MWGIKLPNGTGSITKLKGKRRRPYMVRKTTGFTDDGKQTMAVIGYYATRKEALTALMEYNNAPIDPRNLKMTFKELYDLWYKQKESTVSSMTTYEAAYLYCKPLNDKIFADLRVPDFQECIDKCPRGVETKSKMKILMGQMSSYAMANDIIRKDYVQYCTLPPRQESTKHQPFTEEEINILWGSPKDYKVQLILILIYTGMRVGELLKIERANVHLDERYMVGGIKTKAGKDRIIPIADKIFPFIEKLYSDNETKYLVPAIKKPDKPMIYNSFIVGIWEPLLTEYKLKKHLPHDTRHTCATLMSNAEIDMKIRKMILGHASKDITERVYTHKTIEDLKAAINKI